MRRYILLSILLVWTLLLMGGYFLFHKPALDFSLPAPVFPGWTAFGLHWIVLARDLAAALGVFLVSLGLGRLLLARYHMDGLDGLAIQTALGGGILSLVWLGMAAAGWISPLTAWGLWAAALVLLHRQIRAGLAQLAVIKDYWTFAGAFERVFLAAAAGLAANQLWIALAPPLKYDALTYHLTIPTQTVAAGGLAFSPANPYWGHPQVAEMLFTWAAALGRPETAALLGWLFGLTALAGTAGMAARWLPTQSSARAISAAIGMALAALLSAGTVRWMTAWAYTDLFSALMGVGGLSCLLAWRESGRRGWILWMGVYIGLAAGTKYTAGVLALLLLSAGWVSPGANKKPLRSILLSGLVSLLVFAPWALKNLAFTGNPLFPYAVPSADYSTGRLAAANLPPESVDWGALVALPLSYTWRGIDSSPGSGSDLGPLLVLFTVPGLLALRRLPAARILAAGLLLVWALIALGGARFDHLQQPRLYFALLPALGCAAGWGWSAVQQVQIGGLRFRRVFGAVSVFCLCLVLLIDLPRPLASGAVLTTLGLRGADVYLYDNTGVYYEAVRALRDLPPGARVLMLWEGRGLYAPASADPDPWLDRWRTDAAQQESPEAILSLWQKKGYTNIMLYVDGMQWMRAADRALPPSAWQGLDSLLAALPPPISLSGDHYRIYTLP